MSKTKQSRRRCDAQFCHIRHNPYNPRLSRHACEVARQLRSKLYWRNHEVSMALCRIEDLLEHFPEDRLLIQISYDNIAQLLK